MRWSKDSSGGLVVEGWTPDRLAERNEELAWRMRNRVPFHLVNGHLLGKSERGRHTRESIAEDLRRAMMVGRGKWKGGLRELALAGEPVNAEGTYGALAAYPLAGALGALTLSATESLALTGTGAQAELMPLPGNGILSPQAYRFTIGAFYTTVATPGSLITTIRLGNANTSPSLGASASVALTASLTSAVIILKSDLTIQQAINVPGANSKAVGHHDIKLNTAVGGAFNSAAWATGTTAASFDTTLTSLGTNGGGVWIGMADTGATNHGSVTVQQVHFMDWN